MGLESIATNFISQLGNSSSSVVPLLIKDSACNASITAIHTKAGGKRDGKEKFIDEYGTEALWIGGIPLIKKIFDLTVYKLAGINPNFDVRKLDSKNADNIEFALKHVEKNSKDY